MFAKFQLTIFAMGALLAHCPVKADERDDRQGRFDGVWRVDEWTLDGENLGFNGMGIAFFNDQDLQLFDCDGKTLRCRSRYHFSFLDSGVSGRINLIPRPKAPETGRELSDEETEMATGGFEGRFRVKDDKLEIWFPKDSDESRAEDSANPGGDGLWYFRFTKENGQDRDGNGPPLNAR